MVWKRTYWLLASVAALFNVSLAHASVIVETVNTGFSGSSQVTIGGDTLTAQTSPLYGPQSLYVFDTYYGGNHYATSYQGTTLGLSGYGVSFTQGLLSNGTIVQAGTSTTSSERLGGYQENYGLGYGYHAIPYYYSCGFSTCEGYTNYQYSYVVDQGPSFEASPLGYGATGYLGLDLIIDGETHYGWAEVEMGDSPESPALDILSLAYETNANTAIAAGATTDVVSVPEPASLTLLLAGLVGMMCLRRREDFLS